ncbi:Hypothetical protein D9617_19g102570 [Elsinoe fawcettii]|nr:Hypothetical protein D9617_19g102570 [Elsinoe fawcettii]
MRMTRAQAAALQETENQEGVQDASMTEQNSLMSVDSVTMNGDNACDSPPDDFRQSTRSTKSKKGSRRGKKQFELLSEDVHVDEIASNLDDLSMDGDTSFSKSTSKRVPSGCKTATLVAVDENAEQARPGSPELDFSKSVLKPKSQAKQLLAKEKMGMRSSSNKENVQPGSSATVITTPQSIDTSNARDQETPAASIDVVQSVVVEQQDEALATDSLDLGHNAPEDQKEEPTTETVQDEESKDEAIEALAINEMLPQSNPESMEDVLRSPITDKTNTAAAQQQTSKPKAATSSKLRQRESNNKTSKPRVASGEVNIPHSKPRPISMSFPTPPPPPKSSRPPTKPTFTLPGEAVAAKLKAAKEARLASAGSSTTAPTSSTTTSRAPSNGSIKRAKPTTSRPSLAPSQPSTETKKPAFKARPAPKMSTPTTIVRQTKASQARESLMSGSLSRSTSVRETKPRTSLATSERRASVMPTSRSSLVSGPRPAAVSRARPQSMIVPRTSTVGHSSAQDKRQSLALSTAGAGQGTAKGRAVFSRAKEEQAELERKRKEKEDAARRAREEASRRGREASRLWAQKRKENAPPPAAGSAATRA